MIFARTLGLGATFFHLTIDFGSKISIREIIIKIIMKGGES